jgi:hypothetical protein
MAASLYKETRSEEDMVRSSSLRLSIVSRISAVSSVDAS